MAKVARSEERKLRELASQKAKKLTPMERKQLIKQTKEKRKAAASSSIAKTTQASKRGGKKKASDDKADGDKEPQGDTDSDDEAVDEILLKGTDSWKEELKQEGLPWKDLKRKSEKFDIRDPYWSDRFIKLAFHYLDSAAAEDTEDVPYLPDRTLTLAPTMGPKVLALAKQKEPLDFNNVVVPSTPLRSRRREVKQVEQAATPDKRLAEVTEGLGMYNTLANFLEERQLWNAELESTEDVEDPKAVNTTGVLIVPDEATQNTLADIDNVLDNLKLQREDLQKARATFGVPDDADKFHVPGMRTSRTATYWQILAADAMCDAFGDEHVAGLLLADDVGLGKTWASITFLLKVSGNSPCGRHPQGSFFMLT